MTNVQRDFNETRHSTGVLLPYQARWAADKSPVKVWEKSRRIGASWGEAADSTLYASEKGSGEKRDVWYIGYNKDMAQEFIRDCGNWARAYNLAASEMEEYEETDMAEYAGVVEEKKILAFRITFASGWRITALSSRPSNLRGKQGRIIIDEAAFHEDLAGLLKAALAMLIWGGQVYVISTHFGDANEFNSLVQDIRAGKKKYSLHRTTFDEALDAGLYRRICQVKKHEWTQEGEDTWKKGIVDFYGDDADEELYCIPSQGSGIFLTRALIEGCMSPNIPVIRYKQPTSFAELADHLREAEVRDWCEETLKPLLKDLDPNRNSYFGEDFGRTGDLTVIEPLCELQNATFRAPFSLELRNIPFQQQEQILFYIVDRLPRFRYGALDARGNGQYLAERAMQKYGSSRIAQVMLTESWYRENMPKYKDAFESKSVTHPKDADVIEDHRAIRVIKGVAKLPDRKTRSDEGKQRHGDSAIAGALAWFATLQEGGPAESAGSEATETDYHAERPGRRSPRVGTGGFLMRRRRAA
jgi:phage FluMu gp28-like protein